MGHRSHFACAAAAAAALWPAILRGGDNLLLCA